MPDNDERADRGQAPDDDDEVADGAQVPDEFHDAIDDALQLLYSQYVRIAGQLFAASPPRLGLAELYESPVADVLVHLSQIAVGAEHATRDEVQQAIDAVTQLLFAPAGATSYTVPRSFWEGPLGEMLMQAKFRTFDTRELMTIREAAAALAVARPTIYRWIDERRLDSVRDGLGGRTYVVRAGVEELAGDRAE